MRIFSSHFTSGDFIPSQYTCDGQDIPIPLKWQEIPQNTKSLALIMDDPDAPGGIWVHWIVYNIPPSQTGLAENQTYDARLEEGGMQGLNSWGKNGYGGPCPPKGTHHYYFKLYALDCMLEQKAGMTKTELLADMQGHILAEAQMVGLYHRK
jgi:Raf kinase inhibitor-like YbhB/YbcL family protein